jgi:Cysteine-rich secretory protein family
VTTAGDISRTHRLPRRAALGLVVALAVGFSGAADALHPTAAHAQTAERDATALENEFVAGVNALRASQGLPAFIVDADIRSVAMGWTVKMADAGRISHNPNLATEITAPWRKLGENVGTGPDAQTVEEAFENSPGHRRNLLDPEFTHIAITVVVRGERLYVTQQFRTPSAAATPVPTTAAGAPTALALVSPATNGKTKATGSSRRRKVKTVRV